MQHTLPIRLYLVLIAISSCLPNFISGNATGLADDFKPIRIYPIAEISKFRKRPDLAGNILCNRPLNSKDVRILLNLCDILIDKTRHEELREAAVVDIGLFGHQFGIPALLAVIRDKSEKEDFRVEAVHAISRIADKRTVDHLIGMLQDKKLSDQMADRISEQLLMVTGRKGRGIGLEKGGNSASATDWKKWWKANRKQIKLDRDATFGSW